MRRWSSFGFLFLWACASQAPGEHQQEREAQRFGPVTRALAATAAATVIEGQPVAAPVPDERVITIHGVGDCAIGDLHHGAGAPGSFAARIAEEADPLAYPFSGVAELFANDDLTLANLEGTFTDEKSWQNPVFSIRGKPEWARMLVRGGVDWVDVDNNHSGDYGPAGHDDTKRALEAAGVPYYGRGHVARKRIGEVEVVSLGYLGGEAGTPARATADVRREKKPGTIVIVSFHWGVEGFYATHPDQQRLAHRVIDAGADLVLGHHPHVLQGVESYKGKPIAYSLGNFVFGANSKPADMDSMIIQARFHLKKGELDRVEHTLIPVRISSTTRHNDFRPTVLEGEERERVLAKVAALSAKLGG